MFFEYCFFANNFVEFMVFWKNSEFVKYFLIEMRAFFNKPLEKIGYMVYNIDVLE